MRIILYSLSDAVKSVVKSFFANDLDVMSDEVRQILSNPEDAKKYKEAVKQIELHPEQEVTIKLSDKTELTLVQ